MKDDKVIRKSKIDILELARKETDYSKMQDMRYLIAKLREIRDGN